MNCLSRIARDVPLGTFKATKDWAMAYLAFAAAVNHFKCDARTSEVLPY